MSLTGEPPTPSLQLMLAPLFSGKTLRIKLDVRLPVAVLAVQRHLCETEHEQGSYGFDVTVTDGASQAKCLLHPSLNHLIHSNVLRTGIVIYIDECSFVHNERILRHGFLVINRLECGSAGSDILRQVRDISSTPLLCREDMTGMLLQLDAPLQMHRRHYLNLWTNEDPEGSLWAPKASSPEVLLDVSKIIPLCDLALMLGRLRQPPPVVVRILHRSRLRYYGKIGLKIDVPYQAYLEVADSSGATSVVLWNELCPQWYETLTVGTVLYLQNYTLKPSYAQRSRPHLDPSIQVFHSVEICLNAKNPTATLTVVPPRSVSSQWRLPSVVYRFTPRSELDGLISNTTCDVIGLVTFVGRVERIKSKEKAGPEKYWTYRWVHAIDGTSNLPFILEIFATSQPDMFEGIYPGAILVATQMRVCHVEDCLPYLTSSCETQIYITGCHRTQPYVSDATVKNFIQWMKTQKDDLILSRAFVGGHYSYPPASRVFTQRQTSNTDSSAGAPLVSADDLKRELSSMQYREHKRLAIQGRITAVWYLPAQLLDIQQRVEDEAETGAAAGSPLRDQRTAESLTDPEAPDSARGQKKRRLTKKRSETAHGHAVDLPVALEQSESDEEEEGPILAEQVSTCRDGASWENPSWPRQKQELSEHLHAARLATESLSQSYTLNNKNHLMQLGNLHPARWRPEHSAATAPTAPSSCQGYYHTTILGINQQVAIDAAFVPVVSSGDPSAWNVPQDPQDNTLLAWSLPQDNTLLACLSAGRLHPRRDPQNQGEEAALLEPEEILGAMEELGETPLVCVLDLCHLGGDRVEVILYKVYSAMETNN